MKYSVGDLQARIETLPMAISRRHSTNTVLVTGATGWLGRHVVDELLARGWNVVAPVRALNDIQMWERVAHWSKDANFQPIAVHSLLQSHLYPNVDGVIHIAADMSLANTLEQAWDSNVANTQHLFQWARLNGARRFDFISTLSVFVSSDAAAGRLYEDQDLHSSEHVYGGYAASKWCAEAWLNANRFGMELGIHRLGLLSHSHRLGWAPTDGISAWAQAWRTWGKPSWMQSNPHDLVDWTPTEYATHGIVEAFECNSVGAHHWANTRATPSSVWHDLFEQQFGDRPGEWPRKGLGKHAHRALGRWSQPNIHHNLWWHDVFQSDRHTYDQSRSQNIGGRVQWTVEELRKAIEDLP